MPMELAVMIASCNEHCPLAVKTPPAFVTCAVVVVTVMAEANAGAAAVALVAALGAFVGANASNLAVSFSLAARVGAKLNVKTARAMNKAALVKSARATIVVCRLRIWFFLQIQIARRLDAALAFGNWL